MKTIFPDYYPQFQCIAGACRHSCCVGWEIDVDPDSMKRYERVPGALGEKLKENIETSDCPHFRLGEGERCPFLNEQNLCELILELGEDALCQICSDHPRFRNEYSFGTEMGLGLCCEAAAGLILGRQEPFCLVCHSDGLPEQEPDEREAAVLCVRARAVEIMQDRRYTVAERTGMLLTEFEARMPEFSNAEWADFFLSLERLDPVWTDCLRQLRDSELQSVPSLPELEIPFEQLILYLLYRHLPAVQDTPDLKARIGFAVLGYQVLFWLCGIQQQAGGCSLAHLLEFARLYSSEIEYSEENTNTTLDLLWEENTF